MTRALGGCLVLLLLAGCQGQGLQPEMGLNPRIAQPGDDSSPSLAATGMAWIAPAPNGHQQIRWLDFASGLGAPLPGLNRPDAQPISVGVDRLGQRFALVRSLEGRTELLIYERNLALLRPIPLLPAGVPAKVALSGDGRVLAVQVSREGRWQVEVINLP
ncbi:hypothetical protein [Synechococcus sp. UW140]|uniref:hypothetical protein n=1 Tax=Synechococcus TaxID=1129 RepID=UPI003137A72F